MLTGILALVAAVCWTQPVAAQGDMDDPFLNPQLALPMYVGLDLGYTFWDNDASFIVSDQTLPCATFTNGDGKGPIVGAKGFLYLNTWLMFSPRFHYEGRRSTFITPLAIEPTRDISNNVVMIEQEAQADVEMSSLTLDLRMGIEFAESGFYVAVGGAANLLLNGTYDYTERLLSPAGIVYEQNLSTEQLLADGWALENYQSFSIEARGGVGYLFAFGKFALNPEVYYSFPITSALSDPDRMKQSGLAGSVGFLLNIGE
jgi:hypothetical protein